MKTLFAMKPYVLEPKREDQDDRDGALQTIARLDWLARDKLPQERVKAGVRDASQEFFFSWTDWHNVNKRPEISLMLAYNPEHTADIAALYADLRDVDLPGLTETIYPDLTCQDSRLRGSALKVLPSSIEKFSFGSGYVWELRFQRGNHTTGQMNKINVIARADPEQPTVSAIEIMCKEQGAEATVYTSEREGPMREGEVTFSRKHEHGGGIAMMSAPEVEVVVTWPGNNFEGKALDFYSKIRKLLMPAHLVTTTAYAANIMGRSYGDPETLSFGNDGLCPSQHFPNFHCHFKSQVPFQHDGERLAAELSYRWFRG